MTKLFVLALLAMSIVAFADTDNAPLGDALTAGQYIRYESTNATTLAWVRSVVMSDREGNIIGDNGVVGEKTATDAIDYVASNAYEIAQSANASMIQSMDYLYSKTNQMAKNCVEISMHIAPETSRENLTGYVIKTESDGYTDTQYVYYNKVLGLMPSRYVEYSYYGGTETVKADWGQWTTNGITITVDGKTWSGVHVCTLQRPSFARGEVCMDIPNEVWGGANGMDFGDMLLHRNGTPYFTGFVTNGITGDVIYFDNGFRKPPPES